jgi:Ca2+-binding RTX toxin-like protein
MRSITARLALGAAAAIAATLSFTPAALAVDVQYQCRASAVTAQVAGGSILDPITAGRDDSACRPAISGLPNIGEALSLEDIIKARTAYAATDPGGAPPVASTPSASAGIEGLDLTLGDPVLSVGAARSSITATCVDGAPVYTPFSEVASITLGGTPIVLDGVLQPITDGLSDAIGGVLSVRLNEVVELPGGGRSVRAAHITVLAEAGTPLAAVIIAESRIDATGAVCDPNAPGNGGDGGGVAPGGGSGGGDTTGDVCPPGSVYDVSRNLCVIPVPGSQTPENPAGDLTGPGSVIVGRPYTGPSGGTVITLGEARKRFNSPCLRGKGPKYVVYGTKGADHITGTNRRDRMLGLKGRDRLDGGRNDDCIDGGKHRDVMTGGQDEDRVFGKKGRDAVNGDSGTDKLVGGRGNDSFNAGYGADRVKGGRGRDVINVATSGPRARVTAGPGYDVVTCNAEEQRSVRGAERLKITSRGR